MSDNYDQLALSWVRKEINNTLEQARQGLESFAEDTQDQTQIQFCINCLHQVQGTLQMLDFSGAAKLAQEMEMLAEKMSNDETFAKEANFEVLMRALLQMPGYLERVEEGQKDLPVILLPLINELRVSSGQIPISERELFSAETFHVIPPKATQKVSESDKTTAFQDNAKKLRAHFQKGLTGLIRGENPKESLSRIHKVLLRLEALTEGASVARLWWIADGFIFSITESGLYKKKEIHQLLAQVDKQIRRLSELGASAMSDIIPEKLLSDLLYFVARSHSTNARVESLKKEFNLSAVLADSQEVKKHQDKLTKPDSTAVTSVVGAINEELATVKDQLDLFIRAQVKDVGQLQSLVESLNRISDTLTLLELGIPRDVIRQQIVHVQGLIDSGKMPDDAVVMELASALLLVEVNLKNVNLNVISDSTDETDASNLSQVKAKESQVDEATQALIKVARKSMQSAKDQMINYIASGFEQESLSDVPSLLDEVLGGVRIISFDEAARVLEVAKAFIVKRILEEKMHPKEEHLDALADVITSVEYYLEASEEGASRGVDSILKGAENSVNTLTQALAQASDKQDVESYVEQEVEKSAAQNEDIFEIIDEPVSTEKQESESTEINKEHAASSNASAEVIPILTSSANKQIDETLIDEEVLEIFLEEAEEEIQVIQDMLPRWINNIQDEEAMTTIRRSFHTLKGSGRLVGASIIGETSWAVENMLNKVIEESIPAESPVIGVLNEALSLLPGLVKAFANQEPCEPNYLELIARAEHIAAGKPLSTFEYVPMASEVEEVVEFDSEAAEVIDPVLLDIFSTEADSHLEAIAEYLEQAPKEGTCAVSDELIRALHTLKGSANMAGVAHIAAVTGPWEKIARHTKGANQRFESATIELLTQTYQFLDKSLEKLKQNATVDSNEMQQLLDKIAELGSGASSSDKSSAKSRDQQFISIFLTEGLDILQEVTRLNGQLERNLSDQLVKESIRAELHTFHRGAEMVSIDELESLAKASEKLGNLGAEADELNNDFNLLLSESVETMTEMLNRIASEEDIESPEQLVEKINQWMEKSDDTPIPEDMDEELVELFVEEGEELIETARDLLARWKDNLHNKEIISELRRIYHTVKGSSRMAGAMTIGDLGYAVEDIFNTVVDFGRSISEKDYHITVQATDKLEGMIATLKRLNWPKPADAEIAKIRQHLSPDEVIEEVEEDIPTVVESVSESDVELELAQDDEQVIPELETFNVEDKGEYELDDEEKLEEGITLETEIFEPIADEDSSVEDVENLSDIQIVDVDKEDEKDFVETENVQEYTFDDIEQAEEVDDVTEVESLDATSEEDLVDDESLISEDEIEASEELFTEADDDEEIIEEFVVEDISETTSEEDEIVELESNQEVSLDEEDSEDFGEALSDLDEEVSFDEHEDADELTLSDEVDDADELDALEELETPEELDISEELETPDEQELPEELDTADEFDVLEDTLESETAESEDIMLENDAIESEKAKKSDSLREAENLEELVQFSRQELNKNKGKESSTEVIAEDRISPAAPVVVSGNVHQIELDEDGEEVLEIYLEEAEELLEALDEALHEWSESLDNKNAIDVLQRTLHTFKGGARLSDLVVLGDLTHEMETYFEKVNNGQLTPAQSDVDFMLQGYDVIDGLVNEVRNERKMTVPEAYMLSLDALIKGESVDVALLEEISEVQAPVEDKTAEDQPKEKATAEVVSFEKKKQQQEEFKQKNAQTTEMVRVTAEQLENLVNLAGETSIFRSRLEQQMSVLRYNLEEMNSTVERLRDQLRNLDIETDAQISYRREVSGGSEYEDFDPLEMDRYTRQQELTRGLSESAVDLVSLKETLDLLTADSETLLLQQGRVNTEMQESLMRTRMIPFESLVPRLRRMVRQISTELGKTIELSISADGEMDRTVLERLIAPLEHMLRNAMDHGIEPPEERRANQKSETGTVKISMYREGSEVFVNIQDDGRGLNLQAIRKKAVEKGLITESTELTDHELQQLILEAGFSTAEQITQISGRGVGMDVVSSEIKQLGGVIEIDSKQGQGTTFTVKLPFTMSVNHALMVKLGEEVYAIPLANIEGIVRVSPFELEEYYSNPDSHFEYAGIDYSMYHLGQMLDHQTTINLQGVTQPLPVLLLHGADHPTALQVDDLLGSREIVVKSIGSQLSSISGLSGATILGDGRVVVILDMPALIRRVDAIAISDDADVVEVVDDRDPVIMVVDDSITVRKVTRRLLERHDFEVITAKDGVDALSILGEQKPDVMLLDIEMPRMDGFELATIIRHDDGLKDLPIIMITSRTGEKHRERADQIGVNEYMGKPYNEVDLLESISALLPKKS